MEIDLGLGLLDHQLLDRDGRRCGKVDDLELEGVRDGAPRVGAFLTGAPVWRGRGRLGRLAARLGRGRVVRVPWQEVTDCEAGIHLRGAAAEYGLGRGDDRAATLVERIPGASL